MAPPQTVTLHGHEIAYREAGDGDEAVLLIHGMAGSSHTWAAVQPALADRYRVIAPDLFGHGHSDKPMGDYSLGAHASVLRDLLVALGVSRVTVVGQSLGGGVAMQFAYQYPEFCERLVLIGSGGLGREVTWILRLLTLPGVEYAMPVIFPRFVAERGNAVSRWIADRGWRAPHVAEMWRAYESLTEPENRKAFVQTLRAVVDPGGQTVSARDRLYLTERMPALIIWGDADPVIPVSHAHEAHDLMPGSRLEILPGVGHFPHAEVPEKVTQLLTDFIEGTEPADATDLAELLDHRTAS